jgi:hypothetical protein
MTEGGWASGIVPVSSFSHLHYIQYIVLVFFFKGSLLNMSE